MRPRLQFTIQYEICIASCVPGYSLQFSIKSVEEAPSIYFTNSFSMTRLFINENVFFLGEGVINTYVRNFFMVHIWEQ